MAFNDPPWIPVTDRVERAHLDKATEELTELTKAIARIGMQGIEGEDPGTGTPNALELRKEATDVFTTLEMLFEYYKIPHPGSDPDMLRRSREKRAGLEQWHRELEGIDDRGYKIFDGPAKDGIATIGGMPVAVGVMQMGGTVITASSEPVIRSFLYGEPEASEIRGSGSRPDIPRGEDQPEAESSGRDERPTGSGWDPGHG